MLKQFRCALLFAGFKNLLMLMEGQIQLLTPMKSRFKILSNWNFPVNYSQKQTARLYREKPVVLLVQYQTFSWRCYYSMSFCSVCSKCEFILLTCRQTSCFRSVSSWAPGALCISVAGDSYCSFLLYVHGIRHYDSCHNTIVSHLFNSAASVLCHSRNVLNSFCY